MTALFIFLVTILLVLIRGGAARYRVEQLSIFNFTLLFPFVVVVGVFVIVIFVLL